MKITEVFGPTIQGEGLFSGRIATFIRTFGCVPPFCTWCDTKYSWNNPTIECFKMTIEDIMNKVNNYNNRVVVITGGEPYAQPDIYKLINTLIDNDYEVHLETSGKAEIKKYPINDNFKIIMSPKQYDDEFKFYDLATLKCANYYKFVLENEKEMQRILIFINQYKLDMKKCYLMPKGATRTEQIKNSTFVIEKCCKYGLKYGCRLHVLLNDNKRGV